MRTGSGRRKPTRKALLIVNPAAGTRRGLAPTELARLLGSHGLEVDCRVERRASEVARGACGGGYDLVIAAGGDGTIRAVACATDLPVAILPAGTSNSIARSLGVPLDMKGAARVAATGPVREIDLGEAEGPNLREPKTSFLLCASAGFDAETARIYEEKRKREEKRGRRGSVLRYAIEAVKAGANFEHTDIRVSVPSGQGLHGPRLTSGKMVIASNMRHYAGWLRPAPEADPTDGLLDLVAIRAHGPMGLAGAGLFALLGWRQRPGRSCVRRLQAMRWESDREVPVEIDGEPAGWLPVDLRVRPAALRMVTGG